MAEIATLPAEKAVKGFKLILEGDFVTTYKAGKKVGFLNHSQKELVFLDKKVPVATQDQLKEVYDADPSYVSLVQAPENYTAPWAKK